MNVEIKNDFGTFTKMHNKFNMNQLEQVFKWTTHSGLDLKKNG